jgi:P4 family phage/plasmid primase-like protien
VTASAVQCHGATPDEWAHFSSRQLGLTNDLLPVLCKPGVAISPRSSIKTPGKVPSVYNVKGELVGLTGWTQRTSTLDHIGEWQQVGDYGICVQTRRIRAIDVDVTDPELAARIASFIEARHPGLPRRQRANSSKFLLAIEIEGDLPKRKVHVADNGQAIEFLANGQQFVAVGTHPSGTRYEWVNGLPECIPLLSREQADELWNALVEEFGTSGQHVQESRPRLRGADLALDDPLGDFIKSCSDIYHGNTRDGALIITCPFGDQHTGGEPGDTSTVYFRAGTNGYERGRFVCFHTNCCHRHQLEFAEALGYDSATADFAAFDDVDPAAGGAPSSSLVGQGPPAQEGKTETPVFGASDFPNIASALWRTKFGGPEACRLAKWNGLWYEHCGTHYRELSSDALGALVHRYLVAARREGRLVRGVRKEPTPFKPTRRHIEETLVALRSLSLLQSETVPAWTQAARRSAQYRGIAARDVVSLSNGLFHLPSKQLLPHTPMFFTLNALPYEYLPDAPCSQWTAFLDGLWPHDQQTIDTLQEFMGYLLTADTSQQKIGYIVGPRRSGKGTILKVIHALLGAENVAGPTLSSLATQFGLAPLIGKLAAIIGDARAGGREIQATVERLLSISGEDLISIDRKNRDSWEGQLTSRFVIASNDILRLPDASGALSGRMLLFRLTQSFYGKEDHGLYPRLEGEMPGIFNWALAGLERLHGRGRFVQPESSREAIEQLQDLNSPVTAFVEQCCHVRPGLDVKKDDLYRAYRRFAQDDGLHPDPFEVFSKNLYAAFPGVTRKRPRDSGTRVQVFSGIALTPETLSGIEVSGFGPID